MNEIDKLKAKSYKKVRMKVLNDFPKKVINKAIDEAVKITETAERTRILKIIDDLMKQKSNIMPYPQDRSNDAKWWRDGIKCFVKELKARL